MLALRVGGLKRTEYGALCICFPEGNTGRQTVPLLEAAVPNLLLWIRNHPRPDDMSAPRWCGVQPTGRIGEPIGYRMAFKMLRKTAERAEITMPVTPYNFPRSRAMAVAQNWWRLVIIERHLRVRGPLLVYHRYRHVPVELGRERCRGR